MKPKRPTTIGAIFAPLVIGLVPLTGQSGTQADLDNNCVNRPISDFLEAQGKANNPPQFFPPVPDYAGWTGTAPTFENFALVDYAGLADRHVQDQGGHPIWQSWTLLEDESYVKECSLDVGAEIRVHLVSENAMGLAQPLAEIIANFENNDPFPFLNARTIFGSKVEGVPGQGNWSVPGKWAFGSANLWTTFTIPASGVALPDLLDVISSTDNNDKLTYGPVTLDFHSATQGRADEKRQCLKVDQQASTSPDGTQLVFTQEIVEIDPQPCP